VTRAEQRKFREQLLDLARRVRSDVDSASEETLKAQGGEASGSLSNVPLHLADLATDQF